MPFTSLLLAFSTGLVQLNWSMVTGWGKFQRSCFNPFLIHGETNCEMKIENKNKPKLSINKLNKTCLTLEKSEQHGIEREKTERQKE